MTLGAVLVFMVAFVGAYGFGFVCGRAWAEIANGR
jgi:hypothetical protein